MGILPTVPWRVGRSRTSMVIVPRTTGRWNYETVGLDGRKDHILTCVRNLSTRAITRYILLRDGVAELNKINVHKGKAVGKWNRKNADNWSLGGWYHHRLVGLNNMLRYCRFHLFFYFSVTITCTKQPGEKQVKREKSNIFAFASGRCGRCWTAD